jgi:hypothetical protein
VFKTVRKTVFGGKGSPAHLEKFCIVSLEFLGTNSFAGGSRRRRGGQGMSATITDLLSQGRFI